MYQLLPLRTGPLTDRLFSQREGIVSLRAIIADDHPLTRQGVRLLLEQIGVIVVAEAAGGDTLLEELNQHPCDMLLLDLAMPGHVPDGPALLLQVRARYPLLPVLLLTGTAGTALLAHLLRRGIRGAVEKTAPLEELAAAIQCIASGDRFISQALQQRMQAREIELHRRLADLSTHEQRVLDSVRSGLQISQIARLRKRSPKTISRQKNDAMRKLGAVSEHELHQLLHACPTAGKPATLSHLPTEADGAAPPAPPPCPHDDQ